MFRKAKKIELILLFLIIDLNTFGLKIMDFENVALTKVVHMYVIKDMNA